MWGVAINGEVFFIKWSNLRADHFEYPCLPFLKYSYPPKMDECHLKRDRFKEKKNFQPVFWVDTL